MQSQSQSQATCSEVMQKTGTWHGTRGEARFIVTSGKCVFLSSLESPSHCCELGSGDEGGCPAFVDPVHPIGCKSHCVVGDRRPWSINLEQNKSVFESM